MASRHRGCEPGGPEREKAARPRGGRRPFFFAKTRGAPAYEKGDPLGSPPPRRPVRASPPSARATRPGGRRRPSLPQGRPCSTFGAGRLNFRVRHGSGCAPAARAAGPRGALRRGLRRGGEALRAPWGPHSARGRPRLRTVGGGGAYCVSRRARPISGARLRRSRALHLRPINQVVCLGPYRREGPSRGRLPA